MTLTPEIAAQWKAAALARLPKRCRYKVLEQFWTGPDGRTITIYHAWDNKRKKHISASTDYENMISLIETNIWIDWMLKNKASLSPLPIGIKP